MTFQKWKKSRFENPILSCRKGNGSSAIGDVKPGLCASCVVTLIRAENYQTWEMCYFLSSQTKNKPIFLSLIVNVCFHLTHILFHRWLDAIEGFKNASTSSDPTHNLSLPRLQNLNWRTDWSCLKQFLIVYADNNRQPNKNGFHWHTRRLYVSSVDCLEVQELRRHLLRIIKIFNYAKATFWVCRHFNKEIQMQRNSLLSTKWVGSLPKTVSSFCTRCSISLI